MFLSTPYLLLNSLKYSSYAEAGIGVGVLVGMGVNEGVGLGDDVGVEVGVCVIVGVLVDVEDWAIFLRKINDEISKNPNATINTFLTGMLYFTT